MEHVHKGTALSGELPAETMTRIDQALVRLDAGQCGSCFDCGREISERRLRALEGRGGGRARHRGLVTPRAAISAQLRLRPVGFERGGQFPHDRLASHEHADFAAFIQFELAQTLTADEGAPPVSDNGTHMEPVPGKLLVDETVAP